MYTNGFMESSEQKNRRVQAARARCAELEADLQTISAQKAEVLAALDRLRQSTGLQPAPPSKRGPARKTSCELLQSCLHYNMAVLFSKSTLWLASGCACP